VCACVHACVCCAELEKLKKQPCSAARAPRAASERGTPTHTHTHANTHTAACGQRLHTQMHRSVHTRVCSVCVYRSVYRARCMEASTVHAVWRRLQCTLYGGVYRARCMQASTVHAVWRRLPCTLYGGVYSARCMEASTKGGLSKGCEGATFQWLRESEFKLKDAHVASGGRRAHLYPWRLHAMAPDVCMHAMAPDVCMHAMAPRHARVHASIP
jgi:hypothetical protein